MKLTKFWLGLAAPVVLLASGPALAQQGTPAPATAPSGMNESNQTRELESEIEQYPSPSDGIRGGAAADTRIPEQLQPKPKKPSQAARPHAAAPASPSRQVASSPSSIDPSEVQRVFGSDAEVIALASLDAATLTRLQVRLHELGHYKGAIDGAMGPQTRAALEAHTRAQFALKQRLLREGQLTSDVAEQLGVQQGASSGSPPLPSNDTGPSMRGDPLLPPGVAPPPPPSMAPSPTPSGARGTSPTGTSPSGSSVTPSAPPPSP